MLTLKISKGFWIIVGVFTQYVYCQDIIFGTGGSNTERTITVASSNRIPDDVLMLLEDVKNVTDLLNRFVYRNQSDPPEVVGGRRGVSAVAASASTPASCQIEEQIVTLEKPNDPLLLAWPSCVRVKRCGGCCLQGMKTCQPTNTTVLNVTVIFLKARSGPGNSLEMVGDRVYSLEQHEKCACSCKERAEHCTQNIQLYNADACRCYCPNQDEAPRCTGPKKQWSKRECRCACKQKRPCSTGVLFNASTCSCGVAGRPQSNSNSNTTLFT